MGTSHTSFLCKREVYMYHFHLVGGWISATKTPRKTIDLMAVKSLIQPRQEVCNFDLLNAGQLAVTSWDMVMSTRHFSDAFVRVLHLFGQRHNVLLKNSACSERLANCSTALAAFKRNLQFVQSRGQASDPYIFSNKISFLPETMDHQPGNHPHPPSHRCTRDSPCR